MPIKDSAKLAMFLLKAIHDPEGAIINLVDDFKKSEESQAVAQRMGEFIRNKYGCSDTDVYIDTDDTLVLVLSDITEDNVTELMGDMVKLADKTGSYIGKTVADFDEKIRTALERVKVRYDSNAYEAEIIVELPSQKVVDKLKEVIRSNE